MTDEPWRFGVGLSVGKLDPAIAARIERLGKLNDEFRKCMENKDVAGLRQVAADYLDLKMTRTAKEIFIKADELERKMR